MEAFNEAVINFLKKWPKIRRRLEQPLMRCTSCGALRGKQDIRVGKCAGHKVKKTGEVTFFELVDLVRGRIK